MILASVLATAVLFVGTPTQPVAAPEGLAPIAHSTARADIERLRARLRGDGLASGKADYRERERANGTIVRIFSVEVEDAAPNTSYEVVAGGVVVGTVTTDAFGTGDLNLRTISDDVGQQGPVPDLNDGDSISVSGLGISGSFRAR
jgi:hypothetical protein